MGSAGDCHGGSDQLAEFDAPQRQLLAAYFGEGLTAEEISRRAGLPVGEVRDRLDGLFGRMATGLLHRQPD